MAPAKGGHGKEKKNNYLRRALLNRTHGKHKKLPGIFFRYFHHQVLVLFTMVPRNIMKGARRTCGRERNGTLFPSCPSQILPIPCMYIFSLYFSFLFFADVKPPRTVRGSQLQNRTGAASARPTKQNIRCVHAHTRDNSKLNPTAPKHQNDKPIKIQPN